MTMHDAPPADGPGEDSPSADHADVLAGEWVPAVQSDPPAPVAATGGGTRRVSRRWPGPRAGRRRGRGRPVRPRRRDRRRRPPAPAPPLQADDGAGGRGPRGRRGHRRHRRRPAVGSGQRRARPALPGSVASAGAERRPRVRAVVRPRVAPGKPVLGKPVLGKAVLGRRAPEPGRRRDPRRRSWSRRPGRRRDPGRRSRSGGPGRPGPRARERWWVRRLRRPGGCGGRRAGGPCRRLDTGRDRQRRLGGEGGHQGRHHHPAGADRRRRTRSPPASS